MTVRRARRRQRSPAAGPRATGRSLHRQSTLPAARLRERLVERLREHFGSGLRVRLEIAEQAGETVADRAARAEQERERQLRGALSNDAEVREIVETFDGELVLDSIRPVSGNDPAAGD